MSVEGINVDLETNDADQMISFEWKEHGSFKYSYAWLLDNCRCKNCFNSSSLQRQTEPNPNILSISKYEVREDSIKLVFTWTANKETKNHSTEFLFAWLQKIAQQFKVPSSSLLGYSHTRTFLKNPILWHGKEDRSEIPPKYSLDDVCSQRTIQLKLIESLEQFGIVILKNVPQEAGEVEKFGKLLAGFVRPTHYGSIFDVIALDNPNNQAYTSRKLALHTDMPVLQNPPEIQMLHCIKQAENGGDSIFSDGFRAAACLEKRNPEEFSILASTIVKFVDYNSNFHYEGRKVTIERSVTANGLQTTAINLNDAVRDSILELPIEEHQQFYAAYCLLKKELEEASVSFQLNAGDLVCFDNRRVLHGRQQFVATGNSGRFLQGTYVSWQDVLSVKQTLK